MRFVNAEQQTIMAGLLTPWARPALFQSVGTTLLAALALMAPAHVFAFDSIGTQATACAGPSNPGCDPPAAQYSKTDTEPGLASFATTSYTDATKQSGLATSSVSSQGLVSVDISAINNQYPANFSHMNAASGATATLNDQLKFLKVVGTNTIEPLFEPTTLNSIGIEVIGIEML